MELTALTWRKVNQNIYQSIGKSMTLQINREKSKQESADQVINQCEYFLLHWITNHE